MLGSWHPWPAEKHLQSQFELIPDLSSSVHLPSSGPFLPSPKHVAYLKGSETDRDKQRDHTHTHTDFLFISQKLATPMAGPG